MSENDDRRHGTAELIAAILLGIAGVLTAFSAYKAAITDGDALQGYSEATQLLANSNQFYSQALQRTNTDRDLFTQVAIADASGNTEIVDYISNTLMDDNLRGAVDWWIGAVDAGDERAISPFVDHPDNPYENPDQLEAVKLERRSLTRHQEGADADEEGDQYELAAVLFAMTLFFGGIATLLKRLQATYILLTAAAVSSLVGMVVLVAAL